MSGSDDGTLQRWELLTGGRVGGPMLGHAYIDFNPAATSSDGTCHNRYIKMDFLHLVIALMVLALCCLM